MNLDIAIIGAGPAGIAAALQLKRFDLVPYVFEKDRIGGLLWNARRVENYPAFPEGITGAGLAIRFNNHLETFRIPVISEAVISLDYHPQQNCFLLATATETYTADVAIVASGTKPNANDILNIVPEQLRQYVVFEIFPILGLTGKNIVIVGAGDIAFDYALHLSKFQGNHITLVYRSERINALPLLVRRVRGIPYITLVSSAVLKKIEKGDVHPLHLTFKKDDSVISLDADFLVGAIGRVPQTDFISPHLHELEKQLINGEQFYMIGDVKNGHFRQAAIAAGNGIETAMKIYEYRNRRTR